jgi:pilus assembly protein CpaF
MLPQRPSTPGQPGLTRKSGPIAHPAASYETVRRRVLAKLEERLDMGASKRMPPSLLRQSLRQHADQIADLEARSLPRTDRDRLVDEVLGELLGYGPLEELFADPGVREVMVTGPAVVIARREQGQWLPTSVKFRDEAHVRATLDRMATHADVVGPVLASMAVFDMNLPNGFRAIAVIPPGALGQSATSVFIREAALPPLAGAAASKDAAAAHPGASPTGSTSNGTLRTLPGTVYASPRVPGSGLVSTPPPRGNPTDSPATNDPLARHRTRILERLLAKLAGLKIYDLTRFDPHELQKVISAYVTEYGQAEKIYLSDTDQGRLTLEILTSLRR